MPPLVPQLLMEKDDLDNVPNLTLPDGYVLRNYEPGDEEHLHRLYSPAGLAMHSPDDVRKVMLESPYFKPDRIFVVERDGALAGTSAAWLESHDPEAGYLHMVAVAPGHRGKKLGVILTVEAIRYTQREGFTIQRLTTDDWRDAAMYLYLKLGYVPVYTHESHPRRWEIIARRLGREEDLAKARERMG